MIKRRKFLRLSRIAQWGAARLPAPVRRTCGAMGRRVDALGRRVWVPWVPRWGEARLLASLDAALGRHPGDQVVLSAHDILELPALLPALDLCREHGKQVTLITPGLRLADARFARQVADRVARVSVTFLSDAPETYARMTGAADAHARVRAAIRNLVALEVPFHVNCVVTVDNVADLPGVARFLFDEAGRDAFTVVGMLLEHRHLELDPRAGQQIAPYSALDAALRRVLDPRRGSGKRISLVNVPPCRLSEGVLGSGALELEPAAAGDNLAPRHRDPRCARCAYEAACPTVFTAYHVLHPDEPVDVELASRLAPALVRR